MTKASRQTQASRLSAAMAMTHVQFEGLCCGHRALMYSANGTSASGRGQNSSCNLPVGIHHLDIWMEERPCIPPHNSPWGTFIVPVFIPPLMWLTRGPNQNIGFLLFWRDPCLSQQNVNNAYILFILYFSPFHLQSCHFFCFFTTERVNTTLCLLLLQAQNVFTTQCAMTPWTTNEICRA